MPSELRQEGSIQYKLQSFGRRVALLSLAALAIAGCGGPRPPAMSVGDFVGGDQNNSINVAQFTNASCVASAIAGSYIPFGNPLVVPGTEEGKNAAGHDVILTQGYGVGSHAPAATWGGVDLAIAGGPANTQGTEVYARHDGYVDNVPDSYPGGNYVWVRESTDGTDVDGDGNVWKTGVGHLQGFAVEDGTKVRAGDLIGYVGNTGLSSGPHAHVDQWGGMESNVNVNPLDYGAGGKEGPRIGNGDESGCVSSNVDITAERIDEIFSKYNSPMVGQGKFMVEMEEVYGVNAEVVLAAMYADSTLGTNLTTPFNPGNIGNTDSCPTCTPFTNWQNGIEAVFQFLRKGPIPEGRRQLFSGRVDAIENKKLVYELSCGGYIVKEKNSSATCIQPIYASDRIHWHANVTSLLAEVFTGDPSRRDEFTEFPIRNN